MKVYVLTHCAAEDNYTPEVFTKKSAAEKRLQEVYDNYLESSGDSILQSEMFSSTSAEIIYEDDTYDVFEIFEVELQD